MQPPPKSTFCLPPTQTDGIVGLLTPTRTAFNCLLVSLHPPHACLHAAKRVSPHPHHPSQHLQTLVSNQVGCGIKKRLLLWFVCTFRAAAHTPGCAQTHAAYCTACIAGVHTQQAAFCFGRAISTYIFLNRIYIVLRTSCVVVPSI